MPYKYRITIEKKGFKQMYDFHILPKDFGKKAEGETVKEAMSRIAKLVVNQLKIQRNDT